ncbi:MAG: hypothetical protein ACKOB9_00450 [Solirubrobacterales bacterium]
MQYAQPPQDPAPYGAQPGQQTPYQVAGSGPPPGRPGGGWLVAAAIVAVLFLVGGLVIGTVVERNKYEAGKPAYDEIYNTGYQAGQGEGSLEGEKAGRKEGRKAGKEVGFQKGRTEGQKEGEIKGTADGASAALGGLSGWDPDANYIVKVSDGPSAEVPFVISRRTEMVRGASYALCRQDPSQVCERSER